MAAGSGEWCFDTTYMYRHCIAKRFKRETVLLKLRT